MNKLYNQVSGQSIERLAALSDGIFAVAMTLLVLDLHVPEKIAQSEHPLWTHGAIDSEMELLKSLILLVPSLTPYLLSFLTLGVFWTGQQTLLNHLIRTDRDLTWLHMGFLFAVSLMPFATELLASFITFRIAIVVYWLNILLLGTMLFAGWKYAEHANLMKEDILPEMRSAITRGIIIAQAFYACGALLCIFNTYVSITVIVLIQLNYALAPHIRWLYRL